MTVTPPETMSGVQLTGHGGPDRLLWRDDLPVPKPGPGQVLVQVTAAGVNNTDINTRLGWYDREVTGATDEGQEGVTGGWSGGLALPRIQGADLCGRVIALGADTVGPPVGARVTCASMQPEPRPGAPLNTLVIGSEYDGAFAQYCVVPARHLYDVTASPLSDVEIAAMPCAFSTAEGMLSRAGVTKGQRVLITGASGGVGLAAVALARLRGAIVTAITDPKKAKTVISVGASDTISREDIPQIAAFDAVIDVVGGAGWAARLNALRPGGHCAVAGAIAGPLVTSDLRHIYLNDITIHGCTYQPPQVFEHLVDLINTGALRPLVSSTYALRDIATAQADFMSKRFPGKLVLIPSEIAQ